MFFINVLVLVLVFVIRRVLVFAFCFRSCNTYFFKLIFTGLRSGFFM